MSADMTKSSRLKDFFGENEEDTWLAARFARFAESTQRVEMPLFPRYLMLEISNICNHACSFCAYTVMQRPKRHMDRALFDRLIREAYGLGAREVGLFSGAEPMTCKWLNEYVSLCHAVGYEYIYISTNGSLGTPEKFKALLDAGLSSIKFSVNGGTRESYRAVHGADHFDIVSNNIRFVSEYRKVISKNVFLAISFVECEGNKGTYDELVKQFSGIVDEIVFYEANNQSGQMPNLPSPFFDDCDLPFNKVHISREGYLRACCNDYENALALEDLNVISLAEAWHSDRFRTLRRRHIENRLEGTLCGNCIRGCLGRPDPLNAALSSLSPSDVTEE